MEEELKAMEAMFKAQGDSPDRIKTTLNSIRIDRLKEIGGTKREWLAILIPSILIIINIFISARRKK